MGDMMGNMTDPIYMTALIRRIHSTDPKFAAGLKEVCGKMTAEESAAFDAYQAMTDEQRGAAHAACNAAAEAYVQNPMSEGYAVWSSAALKCARISIRRWFTPLHDPC